MQYFTQVHCSYCLLAFFHTRSIRVNEEIIPCYIVEEEDQFLRNISLGFICLPVFKWLLLRSKRVKEEIILWFTVQEEDQFLYKISGSLFTCFYMVFACLHY